MLPIILSYETFLYRTDIKTPLIHVACYLQFRFVAFIEDHFKHEFLKNILTVFFKKKKAVRINYRMIYLHELFL
jgi:hypothetical protein